MTYSRDMPSSTNRNQDSSTSTVERAASLLHLFTPDRPCLTLSEVQELSGIPRTTVFRYLSDLQRAGLLAHNSSGYSISSSALRWGRTMDPWHRIRDNSMPVLAALHRHTGLTVNLAISTGEEVILVEKITPQVNAVPHTHVGAPIPAHSTALGKAVLAFLPPDQRDTVVTHSLHSTHGRSSATTHRLRREISDTVRSKVAREFDESRVGYWCAATPIRAKGNQIAAISVAASHDHPFQPSYAMRLREAATSVEHALQ